MMKILYLFLLIVLFSIKLSHAQNVGISDDGLPPTELLHVKSTAVAPHGILIESTVNNPILQWRQGGVTQFSLGVDNADLDKLKLGTTSITVNTRLTIDAAGNVGIGTTTPGRKLTIAGGAIAISNAQPIYFAGAIDANWQIGRNIVNATGEMLTSNTLQVKVFNGANQGFQVVNSGNFSLFEVDGNTGKTYIKGNVGIGTTAPSEKLEVVGNIGASGTSYWGDFGTRTETRADAGVSGVGIRSGYYQTSAPAPATSWPTGAASWWHLLDVRHSNSVNNYAMQFAGSFFDQDLYFRKTNNSAAQAWVKVLTTANGVDGSGTLNYIPKWTPDGTTLGNSQLFDNGTNVGIGTASPAYKFTIQGTGNVFGVDNTASFAAKNSTGTYETYFWPRWSDNIMYLNYGTGGFNIRNNASASTLFMTNAGNVGIGTTSPSTKLEVVGQIKITGGSPGAGKVLVSDATGTASWSSSAPGGATFVTDVAAGNPIYNNGDPRPNNSDNVLNLSPITGAGIHLVMLKVKKMSGSGSATIRFKESSETSPFSTSSVAGGASAISLTNTGGNIGYVIAKTDAAGKLKFQTTSSLAHTINIYVIGYW